MFPDVATLFVGGAGADALGTGFWRQVYGFSMEPVAASVKAGAQGKATVAEVAPADMLTEPAVLRRLDLATMSAADADFSSEFELPVRPQVLQFSRTAHNQGHAFSGAGTWTDSLCIGMGMILHWWSLCPRSDCGLPIGNKADHLVDGVCRSRGRNAMRWCCGSTWTSVRDSAERIQSS